MMCTSYLLPGLEGIAPAVSVDVVSNPSAAAAIEVKVIRRGMNETMAPLGDSCSVLRRDPDTIR